METPGRTILYATTIEFLGHFGLSSLEELPALSGDEENRWRNVCKKYCLLLALARVAPQKS